VILLLAVLGLSPATASAYDGFAYLPGQYFRGTFLDLESRGLVANDYPTGYASIASWVINTPSYDFIEAGIFDGNISSGVDCVVQPEAHATFFWSDQRPGDGYHCHTSSDYVSYDTPYGTTIYLDSNATWSVGVGSLAGKSTNSIPFGNRVETGTVESDQSSYSCSASLNMLWYYSSGDKHEGWYDTSSGGASISQSKPPYAFFMDPYPTHYPGDTWLRHYTDSTDCY
jgi:hypothetical protein